jgi:hypothetical protein
MSSIASKPQHAVRHSRHALLPADESVFWLAFCGESGLKQGTEQRALLAEAEELLAIFTSSAKTASENETRKGRT